VNQLMLDRRQFYKHGEPIVGETSVGGSYDREHLIIIPVHA
jgi:hypothetical protein